MDKFVHAYLFCMDKIVRVYPRMDRVDQVYPQFWIELRISSFEPISPQNRPSLPYKYPLIYPYFYRF